MRQVHIICALCIVIPLATLAQNIVRVGNAIQAPPASQDIDFGARVILLRNAVFQTGQIFGISAFFNDVTEVYFQVWRPVSPAVNSYRLVQQWRWLPTQTDAREEIYIHLLNQTCSIVQTGDLLAIYSPERCPIAYNINPNNHVNTHSSSSVMTPGTEFAFDEIQIPYEFSVTAWINNQTTSVAQCPINLRIPDSGAVEVSPNTPLGASIGSTGSTGSTGPRGTAGSVGALGPVGATGPQGPQSVIGATGVQGPAGPVGPVGPVGPIAYIPMTNNTNDDDDDDEESNAQRVTADEDCSGSMCDTFDDPWMVFGLYVWLAVLTFLFVLYLVVRCCCWAAQSESSGTKRSQSELWRKYNSVGKDMGHENDYAEVEVGKTAF